MQQAVEIKWPWDYIFWDRIEISRGSETTLHIFDSRCDIIFWLSEIVYGVDSSGVIEYKPTSNRQVARNYPYSYSFVRDGKMVGDAFENTPLFSKEDRNALDMLWRKNPDTIDAVLVMSAVNQKNCGGKYYVEYSQK